MLDQIARPNVAVKDWSRELLRKLILLDVFGKREVVEVGDRNQVLGKLGLHDLLLDQLLKNEEIWGPAVLSVALCLCGFVLKGDDLSLELLVE